MYKGYLIDLDGTMFNGDDRIEGAKDFVERLNQLEIPYVFVTNSGERSREETLEKFLHHDIETSVEHIYTAAMACADYVKAHSKTGRVYVIGSDSFKETIKTRGLTVTDEDVEAVLFSYPKNIDYRQYAKAVQLVVAGAKFIMTNPDKVIRHKDTYLPGNGAFASVVLTATDVEPIVVGKPNAYILEGALNLLNLSKDEVAMIGDNYDTDIMTGINGGLDTIHVNTGVHSTESVKEKEVPPTHTVENLNDWKLSK